MLVIQVQVLTQQTHLAFFGIAKDAKDDFYERDAWLTILVARHQFNQCIEEEIQTLEAC